MDLGRKLDSLRDLLERLAPGAIAVSGGLDSRLLSRLAADSGADYVCTHFAGPHVAPRETQRARNWLESIGLPYTVTRIDPLGIPAVAANARDRCYHCKHHLFSTTRDHHPGRTLLDGTNASDHTTYRPGLKALAELHVRSPFAETGISKDDIRTLAQALGLPEPQQPATPCLLTRLPYDTPVDTATLDRLADLEAQARDAGFTEFRVRLIGGKATLFALEGANAPVGMKGMEVVWVPTLSGYWDAQEGGDDKGSR